jgi:hypothetical protein
MRKLMVAVPVLLSCTPTAEVETTSGALNGTVIQVNPFTGGPDFSCNPWIDLIREAAFHANNFIRNPALLDCMRNAVLTYSETAWPEEVVARMQMNVPLHVNCRDLGTDIGARADVWDSKEAVQFNTQRIGDAINDAPGLGSLILHEVAHNKAYTHPSELHNSPQRAFRDSFEYRHSVNEQLARCADQIRFGNSPPVPHQVRLDQLVEETYLAPTGQAGGVAFEIPCQFGQAAMGIQLRNTSDRIEAVGLSCRPGGTGDPIFDTGMAGGSTSFFSFNDCGFNEVLVGVHGRAGQVHDALGPICMHVNQVNNGQLGGNFHTERGGFGGTGFTRRCPPFMAVTSIKGKAGSLLDRLELQCQTLVLEDVIEERLPWVGGSGGGRTLEKCAGRSALVGLTYQTGARVDRLGGICAQVTPQFDGTFSFENVGEATHHMPAHGGSGGQLFEERASAAPLIGCNTPDGGRGVLVGLHVKWDSTLVSVAGICASATFWTHPLFSPSTRTMPAHSENSGTNERRVECGQGAFLVGWEIAHGSLVDGLRPICRLF